MNNPPIDIIPYIRREVYVESTAFKKTYNKNQGHSNNRIKIENVHLEKDDFTIERNTTIIQNNNTGHPINDLNDSLFFREPENQKKLDIKKQLHKWTKHFKEIGKNENIKMKNAMRLNLNILTPDNFQKLKPVFVDLVKNSPENLKLLADKIIEKAWNEPKYITTYASLCSYLQDEKSLQAPSDKLTEDGKKGKNKKLFKGFLLGRIQQAFEKQDFLKTNDGNYFLYIISYLYRILLIFRRRRR